MSPDKLIHMVNQIGVFFESKPHDEGVAGVAAHINAYWEPRMRRQLLDILDTDDPAVNFLVREAATAIRRPSPDQ